MAVTHVPILIDINHRPFWIRRIIDVPKRVTKERITFYFDLVPIFFLVNNTGTLYPMRKGKLNEKINDVIG
jgi:hypothetical protein